MDKSNGRNKGQVLLLVFILLILTGILVTGIAGLWESGLQLNRGQMESLIAFYSAQSGLERAIIDFTSGIDVDENYNVQGNLSLGTYDVSVVDNSEPGIPSVKVTSIGRCGNAERSVSFTAPSNPPKKEAPAWGFWKKFHDSWTEE